MDSALQGALEILNAACMEVGVGSPEWAILLAAYVYLDNGHHRLGVRDPGTVAGWWDE
jgi:hypothetical protein